MSIRNGPSYSGLGTRKCNLAWTDLLCTRILVSSRLILYASIVDWVMRMSPNFLDVLNAILVAGLAKRGTMNVLRMLLR